MGYQLFFNPELSDIEPYTIHAALLDHPEMDADMFDLDEGETTEIEATAAVEAAAVDNGDYLSTERAENTFVLTIRGAGMYLELNDTGEVDIVER